MSNEIEKLDFFGTEYDINGSRLAQKANIDGAYESMTVGNAEQLISSVTVNDKVPYNFRTSGGSIDIGNREVDKLVGGTVAWNQIVKGRSGGDNGVTASVGDDGAFTLDGTATGSYSRIFSNYTPIVGHRYIHLSKVLANPNSVENVQWGFLNASMSGSAPTIGENVIRNVTTSTGNSFGIRLTSGVNYTGYKFLANIIDLTQMFGSAIADYIYSLETATAGAGVAWFKKLFPKDYYPYNAGELISVKTSAHQMVGFNAWDEEWENGYYDTNTGSKATAASMICSKNFTHVIPGATYYVKNGNANGIKLVGYDADKTYIGNVFVGYANNQTVVMPSNCHYINIFTNSSDAVKTYNHDICINLSWDGERDGDYEAYKKWTYPLDSDLELRGIPKLDASNNLYYDGDTYESDGTVTRRYGIVDLGTLEWTKGSIGFNTSSLTNAIKPPTSNNTAPSVMVSDKRYIPTSANADSGVTGSYEFVVTQTGVVTWRYPMDGIADGTAFATLMTGTKLLYPLAEPTTEEADPYQNPQIVDDFGTEEYVDERTVAIPVGHDTEYMNNLKAKLEMAPDSPDGDGDYIVRQTNGENSYVPLMKELPNAPSEDGTYTLKCTVASGVATLGWEREE